jgi:hypothetical protein
MSYYKNIIQRRMAISPLGAKGTKPSFLMPPVAAWSKVGYQIYEATDLLCEGPIAGLVDLNGKILNPGRVTKGFRSDNNTRGSSTEGIDKAVFFNGTALREDTNVSTHSKYDIELRVGDEFQNPPEIMINPSRMEKVGVPIKGPYNMSGGGDDGARTGLGSRDIRDQGKAGRDFVSWQRFVPIEQRKKPWIYQNYDRNVDTIMVGLQVDALSDTQSKASKAENKSGASRMGTPQKLTVTFKVEVGKVDRDGVDTISTSTFTSRAGSGTTISAGGILSITGIITAPYAISLENIILPTLAKSDLYNYIKISKIEHETYSNLVKRDVAISSVTRINTLRLSYPHSAYVSTSLDSKYFPSVPERTFRVKGKKILIPSNYNPTNADGTDRRFSIDGSTYGNLIYNGDWNGTFKFGWSDNPAWIYYDLLMNTRYGLGSHLRDVEIIDKWSLYEVGMYCDAVTLNDGSKTSTDLGVGVFVGLDDGTNGLEPRFSSNLLINDQKSAMGAMEDLARSFVAMMYYNNSSISIRVDKPYIFEDFNRTDEFDALNNFSEIPPKSLKYPPALIFNNLNVKDGIFAYADVDRSTKLSAVEVSYLDKSFNFEARTEYVEDTESIKNVGLNFKSLDGIGCTSRSQARRLARHILFESMHTTETVSFVAGFDGLLTEPGDIIRIDDEIRSFHKNFGIVLGTSGIQDYKNPDGIYYNSPPSGKGPKSIIVSPAIGSDQLSYISGGVINIHNALGKTSIADFYNNPTSGNEFYKDIYRPQVISLKIKPGGAGLSYEICDSGVAINIDGLNDYLNGVGSSQWFSENSANINYGSSYSIDVSGITPKYYRVISTEESTEGGIALTATIHHTGKFKYIEKGVNYDLSSDTFQPNLKITELARPNPPTSITNLSFSTNSNKSLRLNIRINDPAIKVPEKYIIFLTEPAGKIIQTEVFKSTNSYTNVTLGGDSRIDQLGEYELTIFSENLQPLAARSKLATSITFTTTLADFPFSANDSFMSYQNISLETSFSSSYNASTDLGVGVARYPINSGILCSFQSSFEDVFGGSGFEIINEVSGQRIDLRKIDGTLIEEDFKVFNNQDQFSITVDELNDAVQYTGNNRYQVPPNIDFEVDEFTLETGLTTSQWIPFKNTFSDGPPVVFTSQKTTFNTAGQTNYINKIGRVNVQQDGFVVTGVSERNSSHIYIASRTGSFPIDNATKRIEINYVNNSYQTDYKFVQFIQDFDVAPTVFLQSQEPDQDIEDLFSETCITGVSTSGFFYKIFQSNLDNTRGTGILAYIAAEQESFNILKTSNIGVKSLNYNTIGSSNVIFDSTPILNGYGGTSYRFNYDQYSILTQRVADNSLYDDIFFSVDTHGTKNTVRQNALQTGLRGIAGIKVETDDPTDRIQINGAAQINVDTGNFSMLTWGKFQSDLEGKQSLINAPGQISWFQSGDGKNYIYFQGTNTTYLAITGETTLNDDAPKMLQVSLDREQAVMTTYLNGVQNMSVDISDLIDYSYTTGFELNGVGAALSGHVNSDFVTGFIGSNMGTAFSSFGNTDTLDGRYTGSAGGNLFINETFSGFRFEKALDNNWYIVDRDSSSSSYNKTGWRSNVPGYDYPWTVDPFWFNVITNQTQTFYITSDLEGGRNLTTFDGYYTGIVNPGAGTASNIFQNMITSGFKVKITPNGTPKWVVMDDDPGSATYNKTGWYHSVSSEDYPWPHQGSIFYWIKGVGAVGNGTPTFSDISPYAPSSLSQVFNTYQLLNEPTHGTIGALYQGRMLKYAALIGEKVEGNYYNISDGGFSTFAANPKTKFVIDFTGFPDLVDASQNTLTNAISVHGSINRDVRDYVGQSSDFNFLQIGTSGDISRLNELSIGTHPLTDGFKLDFFVRGYDTEFSEGEASFSVTLPDYGINSITSAGASSLYEPIGPGFENMADFVLVENAIEFEVNFFGDINNSGAYNIKKLAVFSGETSTFSPDYIEDTNLVVESDVVVTGAGTLNFSILDVDIDSYTGSLFYKVLPKDYIKTGQISPSVSAQMFFGFGDQSITGDTIISRDTALDMAFASSAEPINIYGGSLYINSAIPNDWRADFLMRNNSSFQITSNIPVRSADSLIVNGLIPAGSDLVEFEISSLYNVAGVREAFLIG